MIPSPSVEHAKSGCCTLRTPTAWRTWNTIKTQSSEIQTLNCKYHKLHSLVLSKVHQNSIYQFEFLTLVATLAGTKAIAVLLPGVHGGVGPCLAQFSVIFPTSLVSFGMRCTRHTVFAQCLHQKLHSVCLLLTEWSWVFCKRMRKGPKKEINRFRPLEASSLRCRQPGEIYDENCLYAVVAKRRWNWTWFIWGKESKSREHPTDRLRIRSISFRKHERSER